MFRPLVRALQPIAALLLFASAACTTAGPKYPDLSSFCTGVANAQCNSNVIAACALQSSTTCIANQTVLCENSEPTGAHYNPAAGEGCVNAYASAYADAKVTLAEMATITQACIEVFEGNGMTNASCVVDSDCQVGSGLRCVTSSAGTSTCQVPQPVAGGGVCSMPSQQCLAGYHCESTGHCVIDGMANDQCSATAPCGSMFLCSTTTTPNTCINKAADGSPCAVPSDCANGICDIAQNAAAGGICVSQITLAPMEKFCADAR
jgi:hypothetical protein